MFSRGFFGVFAVSAVSICLIVVVPAASSASTTKLVAHATSCVSTGTMSRDAAYVRGTFSHYTGLGTAAAGFGFERKNACTWFRVGFWAGTKKHPHECAVRYDAYWKGRKLRLINNYYTYRNPANNSCPYNGTLAILPYSDIS
jgi:hypothetical protein